SGEFRREGRFVMTEEQHAQPPVRDRSSETGSLLKAEYLSQAEINAAVNLVVQESGQIPPEELIRAVARLLGYKRVGNDLSTRISETIFAAN
ncbi:hypothetical protein MCRY_22460, partial [Marivita cryptomonadis]